MLSACLLLALLAPIRNACGQARVRDFVTHAGEVPRRLVGYGLVTGLDGSGDRSWGWGSSSTMSVRAVVNLLGRFHIEVPAEQMRLRNVAVVLVSAEVSPWLRAGGRFDVAVSALGDATSLRGGVLWTTPLVSDPEQPAVATAQGALLTPGDDGSRGYGRRSNAARIPDGGVLEIDAPTAVPSSPRLALRNPDFLLAQRIAEAINTAFGAGVAIAEDPGSIALKPPGGATETGMGFLAAVDTVQVDAPSVARIVIDAREGTVVAGGGVTVSAAALQHRGVTLRIGGVATDTTRVEGLVRVEAGASVQDVAAGLHAAGVRPEDIAAIFESLRAAGALNARVIVR